MKVLPPEHLQQAGVTWTDLHTVNEASAGRHSTHALSVPLAKLLQPPAALG